MNNPLFRPPGEAESLILQVDQGCPHNRCSFCAMYRELPYRRLSIAEIGSLVEEEARYNADAGRIFLADGDVMRRPFDELLEILKLLNTRFPHLARVGLYANGSSICDKSEEQLRRLHGFKLHTLYMGLESGDESLLKRCHKGETALGMVEAGVKAQAAGLRMSVMVLLGLGGADGSLTHAERTAAAVNLMQPRLLSVLRVIPIPGTELFEQADSGEFRELTEWATVKELRDLIARLDLNSTVFRANHSSNVAVIEGRLPHDKERLLVQLDRLLASDALDRMSAGPMPLGL